MKWGSLMDKNEINLLDYWSIFNKNKKLIASFVGFFTIASIIVSLLLPLWYKATVVILPPSNDTQTAGMLQMANQFGFGNSLEDNKDQSRSIAILKSRRLKEIVINKFNLIEKYSSENMEDAIEQLSGNLEYFVDDEMQLSISMFDRDQKMVAEMANFVVACLDSLNIHLSSKKARNNREFIENRFHQTVDSLEFIGNRLSAFMEEKGILELPEQIKAGIVSAAEIQAEIMLKEIEISSTENTYSQNHPEVLRLKFELESLQREYQEFFVSSSPGRLFPEFSSVPSLAIKLAQMERKIEYYTKLLEYLGPLYEQAKIEQAKDIPTLQVLDHAARPEKKAKPRRTLIVLSSILLGLFIGILFAYIRTIREEVKYAN